MKTLISLVVPIYNEATNLESLLRELGAIMAKLSYEYEIILVDDGSFDESVSIIKSLAKTDRNIVLLELSRNFGKEIASTAGLNHSRGACTITLDGDLQHPVALIPEFIAKWQAGADIVVGVRRRNQHEPLTKRLYAWLFYKIMNSIAETKVIPNATDYRLLDRQVVTEFNRFTERNRITRGLIDWLGFEREYIYFDAQKRSGGRPGYSVIKLVRLAMNSFVSLSLVPLRFAGWLGIAITTTDGILGILVLLDRYVWQRRYFNFSGPAILAIMLVFLVGIILICLGLIALYIANIHSEVINRPLYVVRRGRKP